MNFSTERRDQDSYLQISWCLKSVLTVRVTFTILLTRVPRIYPKLHLGVCLLFPRSIGFLVWYFPSGLRRHFKGIVLQFCTGETFPKVRDRTHLYYFIIFNFRKIYLPHGYKTVKKFWLLQILLNETTMLDLYKVDVTFSHVSLVLFSLSSSKGFQWGEWGTKRPISINTLLVSENSSF